jgi:hypothetical protein
VDSVESDWRQLSDVVGTVLGSIRPHPKVPAECGK